MILFWIYDIKLLGIHLIFLILLNFLWSYLESTSMRGPRSNIMINYYVFISSPLTLGRALFPQLLLNPLKLHCVFISATSNPSHIWVHSFRRTTALLSAECLELAQTWSYTSGNFSYLIIDLLFNILKLFIVIKSIISFLMHFILAG